MGKLIEWCKAVMNARKYKQQSESRYREASQLRRELIEMKMERDYWKQRFEGLQELSRAK